MEQLNHLHFENQELNRLTDILAQRTVVYNPHEHRNDTDTIRKGKYCQRNTNHVITKSNT